MNNQPIVRYLAFTLAALVVVLFIPTFITAQEDIPPIPHKLEKRGDCLACHEEGKLKSPKIPDDHEGRSNEECQDCHQPVSEAEPQKVIPPIPHKLEKRGDCLACHEEGKLKSPKIPDDHEGRSNEECQDCHQPVSEVEPQISEAEAPPSAEAEAPPSAEAEPQKVIPSIPHRLENREDCLGCHQEGNSGAPKIPEDHDGRANEVCQDCHRPASEAGTMTGPSPVPHSLVDRENCLECHISAEPTPVVASRPEPLPTPIIHPQANEVNKCIDCHSTLEEEQHTNIVAQSQRSIHTERNVSCADCHGGDPSATTKEEAKSIDAGYIGVPAKADIPALCASCHASVTLMRQYDLPTDQYAKYQESIHGIRLAEGDDNVATCFDCHGGHQILKANDPISSVYPPNVPATCANCHADEELMAPYDIPTNQFALYKQSVHGHALLDNHDLRAPNCASCHGTHGAAPPGFDEVANICGSCHSATQDYYLESPHSTDDEVGPKCVTCHGRYDVGQPSEAMYLGAEPRHCGECHAPNTEAGLVVQSFYDTITAAAQAYDEAELSIQNARNVGMLVSPLEGQLRQANTDLITARAAQHTLNLEIVSKLTDEARATAKEVQAEAEAAIAANLFRRRAMVIAVAIIGLTVVALYVLKRQLDRQLDEHP